MVVSVERRPWTNRTLIAQEIILTHAVETWTGTYKYQSSFFLFSHGVGTSSIETLFEINDFYLNADFLIDRLGKQDPQGSSVVMG